MKPSNPPHPGSPNPDNPPLNPALADAVDRYRRRLGIPTEPVPPLPGSGLDALLALAHQTQGSHR
ncbi:hypothetical protein [Nocardiopsis sp. FIRDI 009]|uniref:hypothetical protein n=1 Tax=Nocardiopsis sp. FIRDI 009 TaxID=714197 RepID=UPI00130021CD|nr:hypothetical protein [Nocardiopsis sp. FIRDI 009]